MTIEGDQGEFHVMPVKVVSSPKPVQVRSEAVYRVITLTPGDQSSLLLPASDRRTSAFVQALDDDAFISNNESDAKAGAGTPILSTNLGPWPIDDHAPVYIAVPVMVGPTSRIGVSATYRVAD